MKLSIEQWTEDHVSSWLRHLGVKEDYIRKLCEEEIDGPVLRDITEEYLRKEIGMKSGQAFLIINNRDQLIKPIQETTKVKGRHQQPTAKDISGEILGNQKAKQRHSTVANTSGSQKATAEPQHDATLPVKETQGPKKDCKPRPFGKGGSNFTYISSNVLPPETGISDLISPCHEYKSFAITAKLDRRRLQAKFAREVLKFGTGCMNIRSNGTIHFGVMDSREDASFVHGEIVGILVPEKDIYVDALDHIEKCFSSSDAEHVRLCVRPPEFIEVTDKYTDEKRYVVEVDIVPLIRIVRNRVYAVRLPNFNEKSNKVIREKEAIFHRVGTLTKLVDDQNEFCQQISARDAQREAAENHQSITMPEGCQNLGRKLTMLVTGGKNYIDKSKWFILVTNRFHSEHLNSIDFLLNMKVFCVFDFDPDSNLSGLCQEYQKHHAANLHFMHDYIMRKESVGEFQSRLHLFEQASWIFCNGRNDFKGKEPCDDMRWFETKKTQLNECASLICKQILPKGTFTLIFLLTSPIEGPLLHTYSEFFSDMGGHEDIICITESEDNFEKWQSFARGFCDESTVNHSSVVGMKISHVNATLQHIQASQTSKHLPTYGKGKCLLESREEERMYSLEILVLDHCDETREDFIEAEKKKIEQHFYHGGKVSWMNFWLAEKRHVGEVIQRDAYQEISNLLSDCLKKSADQLHVHSLNIFHHPGSGGSTVARQVLWNNRKKLRCAVVKPSYSAVMVSEHARYLRAYKEIDIQKCVPVLLLIEDCDNDFLGDLKKELEVALKRRITQGALCFIVLSCRRSCDPEKMCQRSPLHNVIVTHKLSADEKKQFTAKRRMLEGLYKPEFILTFVLMSEEFSQEKISEYVGNFVKYLLQDIDHDHIVTRIIHYVALLNTYVQNSFLSQSHCEALLGLSIYMGKVQFGQGDQHSFEQALTEPARLVFINRVNEMTHMKSIRIIHPLFSKELLLQLLHSQKQESRLALELLGDDVLFEHRFGREDYVKFLRALFIRRDKISKGDGVDSFFSPLIEHVRENEGLEAANNLLVEAYKRFNKDSFMAQHLTRLNYSEENFEEAESWAEQAAKKMPNNPFILHTKGYMYRKWLNKKVLGLKKESKTAERIADAIKTAVKAMDSFLDCQRAFIEIRKYPVSNSGFFAAVEVGCFLLQLLSTSSIFSNKTECVEYLLNPEYIPDKVKKPWEDFHSKLKDLHAVIQTALEWISEDLSYFQTDPSAGKETEDQIKNPKKWLVTKSVEFGEYFNVPDAHFKSGSNTPTPAITRMKIYQLGGGNMTNIFSILTDSEGKDQVKLLEELIHSHKLLKGKNQMDLVNYIACNIALSCLSTQSKALASLKELQDLSHMFPRDKEKCQPNALFLLTLLFWPEKHDSEEDKEKKYELVLSVVKVLTACYFDKMKDMPTRQQRIYTHFFLGNGNGFGKIVHKSKVPWYHEEVLRAPEIGKLLRLFSGRTKNGNIYLEGPQKFKFIVPALNVTSVPYSNENVTFYLGFTMRGPVAINVTIKNVEKLDREKCEKIRKCVMLTGKKQPEVDEHEKIIKRKSLTKKQQHSTEVEKLQGSEKCEMAAGEEPEGKEERREPEEVDQHDKTLDKTYNEVHLNPTAWTCESCANITDANLWNLQEPSISTETGVVVYKHQSPPGSHECAVSGLRWVCSGEVIFQYHLADPHIFKAELATLAYTPIGPLMDISVLLGEIDEAHLPHFACVDRSDSSFSDAVRVLRGVDSGVVLEKCAQLTCRHAKLHHPSFSLVGLLVKMGIPVWTLLDVLVYRTRVEPLTLFIYVVPRDAYMIQGVEDEAKRIRGKRIDKHRPNASIWMNTNLTLVSGMAEISPGEITLKYARPPDLFEVFVENAVESIDLELFGDRRSIWNITLRHVDYSEATGVAGSYPSASPAYELSPPIGNRQSQMRSGAASHMGGGEEITSVSYRERLDKVKLDLIKRGSEALLKEMLVTLQSLKPPVVSQWEADDVLQQSRVLQDQWNSLLTKLLNKGDTACGIMLQKLRGLDYYFYEDLGL